MLRFNITIYLLLIGGDIVAVMSHADHCRWQIFYGRLINIIIIIIMVLKIMLLLTSWQ